MRIVAGEKRGATLMGPQNTATRPTSDRTRESLFNVLHSLLLQEDLSFEDLRVLDVFAGTGALGLEALSRGAPHAIFVEYYRPTLAVLHHNIEKLKYAHKTTVMSWDVHKVKRTDVPCPLIFLDPPYNKGMLIPALKHLHAQGWCAPGGFVVAEVSAAEEFTWPAFISPLWDRVYGAAHIWIGRVV